MDNNQQRNDQPNNGGNQGPQGGPNKNRSTLTFFLAVTLISLVVMGLINNLINNVGRDYSYQEITYDEFLDKLEDGQVQSVEDGVGTAVHTVRTEDHAGQPGRCWENVLHWGDQ